MIERLKIFLCVIPSASEGSLNYLVADKYNIRDCRVGQIKPWAPRHSTVWYVARNDNIA